MNVHRKTRSEFYRRLSAIVDMPTRPSSIYGILWRSAVPGHYHSLVVLAYVGCFEQKYTDNYPRPVPRIHLNDLVYREPSKAQQVRWAKPNKLLKAWCPVARYLEITVTMDELLDFVPWIARWAEAIDAKDSTLILPSPHPLELTQGPLRYTHGYLWTKAADSEYRAHRRVRGLT